jgi:hypothetical protein
MLSLLFCVFSLVFGHVTCKTRFFENKWNKVKVYAYVSKFVYFSCFWTIIGGSKYAIVTTNNACCNTPGVCHQLSSGFELKYDRLSSDEDVKIQSLKMSPNFNLDNTLSTKHGRQSTKGMPKVVICW